MDFAEKNWRAMKNEAENIYCIDFTTR